MKVRTIEQACPFCGGDVKGNRLDRYFCKKCNLLFKKNDLVKPAKEEKPEPAPLPEPKPAPKKESPVKKGKYIVSRKSNKTHIEGCRYIGQIKEDNFFRFEKWSQAEERGYTPCICIKKKLKLIS